MTKQETNKEPKNSTPETREDVLHLVAETLKNKRLDNAISMQDAEKSLNIRIQYLQALELGNWDVIDDDVYALGFLRQYAKYLKCDISESINKLKPNHYSLNKPITFPDPPIAPNRKWMIFSLLGLLVLFVLFNVWKQQSSPLPSQILQEHGNNITQQKDPPVLQGKLPETTEIMHEIAPATTQKPRLTPPKSTNKEPLSPPELSTKSTTISHADNPTSKTKAINHNYVFRAKRSDVWLQIYHKDKGTLLYEVLLKDGQHLNFTSDQILSITCGKPKSLEISMDGNIVVALGTMVKKNHIVRHFILPRTSMNKTH